MEKEEYGNSEEVILENDETAKSTLKQRKLKEFKYVNCKIEAEIEKLKQIN